MDFFSHNHSPQLRPAGFSASSSRDEGSFVETIRQFGGRIRERWYRLRFLHKIILSFAITFIGIVCILVLIYHSAIIHSLRPLALSWKENPCGKLLLIILIIVTGCPPFIGYSTAVTLCGLVYGFFNGWLIATLGTLLSASNAFLMFRFCFSGYATHLVESNEKFAALSHTLGHDRFVLLWMIRLCPLPFSASNASLAAIPTVTFANFFFTTLCATPKLLVHAFIGSQLSNLGDDQEPSSMKVLNFISIIAGASLGAATGMIIYKRIDKRINEISQSQDDGYLAIEDLSSSEP